MPLIKGHLVKFGQIAPYFVKLPLICPLFCQKAPYFGTILGLMQNQGKFEDSIEAFPSFVKASLPLSLNFPQFML